MQQAGSNCPSVQASLQRMVTVVNYENAERKFYFSAMITMLYDI